MNVRSIPQSEESPPSKFASRQDTSVTKTSCGNQQGIGLPFFNLPPEARDKIIESIPGIDRVSLACASHQGNHEAGMQSEAAVAHVIEHYRHMLQKGEYADDASQIPMTLFAIPQQTLDTLSRFPSAHQLRIKFRAAQRMELASIPLQRVERPIHGLLTWEGLPLHDRADLNSSLETRLLNHLRGVDHGEHINTSADSQFQAVLSADSEMRPTLLALLAYECPPVFRQKLREAAQALPQGGGAKALTIASERFAEHENHLAALRQEAITAATNIPNGGGASILLYLMTNESRAQYKPLREFFHAVLLMPPSEGGLLLANSVHYVEGQDRQAFLETAFAMKENSGAPALVRISSKTDNTQERMDLRQEAVRRLHPGPTRTVLKTLKELTSASKNRQERTEIRTLALALPDGGGAEILMHLSEKTNIFQEKTALRGEAFRAAVARPHGTGIHTLLALANSKPNANEQRELQIIAHTLPCGTGAPILAFLSEQTTHPQERTALRVAASQKAEALPQEKQVDVLIQLGRSAKNSEEQRELRTIAVSLPNGAGAKILASLWQSTADIHDKTALRAETISTAIATPNGKGADILLLIARSATTEVERAELRAIALHLPNGAGADILRILSKNLPNSEERMGLRHESIRACLDCPAHQAPDKLRKLAMYLNADDEQEYGRELAELTTAADALPSGHKERALLKIADGELHWDSEESDYSDWN